MKRGKRSSDSKRERGIGNWKNERKISEKRLLWTCPLQSGHCKRTRSLFHSRDEWIKWKINIKKKKKRYSWDKYKNVLFLLFIYGMGMIEGWTGFVGSRFWVFFLHPLFPLLCVCVWWLLLVLVCVFVIYVIVFLYFPNFFPLSIS